MNTMHTVSHEVATLRVSRQILRGHDCKRLSSWRVLGATVAGFPAFLWQLTRNQNS